MEQMQAHGVKVEGDEAVAGLNGVESSEGDAVVGCPPRSLLVVVVAARPLWSPQMQRKEFYSLSHFLSLTFSLSVCIYICYVLTRVV